MHNLTIFSIFAKAVQLSPVSDSRTFHHPQRKLCALTVTLQWIHSTVNRSEWNRVMGPGPACCGPWWACVWVCWFTCRTEKSSSCPAYCLCGLSFPLQIGNSWRQRLSLSCCVLKIIQTEVLFYTEGLSSNTFCNPLFPPLLIFVSLRIKIIIVDRGVTELESSPKPAHAF